MTRSLEAQTTALAPDPDAHAKVLLSLYGQQQARWIAEGNVGSARPSDAPYWSRVLECLRQPR